MILTTATEPPHVNVEDLISIKKNTYLFGASFVQVDLVACGRSHHKKSKMRSVLMGRKRTFMRGAFSAGF
jgi:hypothetical protein